MDPQLRCDLDRDGISSIRNHAGICELLELYFAFYGKSALMAFFHGFTTMMEREVFSVFCRC